MHRNNKYRLSSESKVSRLMSLSVPLFLYLFGLEATVFLLAFFLAFIGQVEIMIREDIKNDVK